MEGRNREREVVRIGNGFEQGRVGTKEWKKEGLEGRNGGGMVVGVRNTLKGRNGRRCWKDRDSLGAGKKGGEGRCSQDRKWVRTGEM